ncbi:uncharacterized protein CANTADRAFT_96617 [Suhomyces tanzawaensis NRRL Y-17324]|uniref:Uncharacterized protein n=1 Tax=Suhomyces tanzawaensis NRRL Y-17324 TaxID=984487 RepID=A0A1E4SEK3_9ASCO|nr:uncharacterized protein CANTADRAFT_96617 [Suhomyces tanzawaensis NRRL Y-17324]ODV77954.1 hypothetical protein CANTADRAFT_96617 [Suhomyces tanzawaensis NRRL Y-17324]
MRRSMSSGLKEGRLDVISIIPSKRKTTPSCCLPDSTKSIHRLCASDPNLRLRSCSGHIYAELLPMDSCKFAMHNFESSNQK